MATGGNAERVSLIVGLGATGLSCARWFAAAGRPFKIVDSRRRPPRLADLQRLLPDADCELGPFRRRTFTTAAELVVSPGVSLKTTEIAAARHAGATITGDIDIFSRAATAPIIAITGSNGKSTVVAILARILNAAGKSYRLGGNLDGAHHQPVLDLLSGSGRAAQQPDFYVLELSSFQLETTRRLGAEVAVLLNLSPDHMDRYDTMEEYRRAKLRVFNGCKRAVINRDDPRCRPELEIGAPVWDFGFSRAGANGLGLLEEGGDRYLAWRFEKIISVNELKVAGQHNVANVLAAIGLALAAGIDMKFARAAVTGFSGLPHRCQWVANVGGVEFYNDSKGTNVGAATAAIEGLGERISGHILLIAGGVAKGADFRPLVPVINRWGKEVILIGQDAKELASDLDRDIRTCFAADMQDAVRVALNHAAPGDAVLLSPACASFDMFEDFQHRGRAFVDSVERLQ